MCSLPASMAIARRPGTEVDEPVGTRTPAAHRAVVEDHAGVVGAGADGGGRAPGTEVHRGDASGRLVVADVLEPRHAQLTEGVGTPAPHLTGVEDGARVVLTGRDRPRRAAGAEVDRTDAPRRLVVADLQGVAVTEVAAPEVGEADTPAAHGPVVEDGAGVITADGDRTHPTPELDRTGHGRLLVVADRHAVGVPEAAAVAQSPATNALNRRRAHTCGLNLLRRRPPSPPDRDRRPRPCSGARCHRCRWCCRSRAGRHHPLPSSAPGCRRRRCTCGCCRRRAARRVAVACPESPPTARRRPDRSAPRGQPPRRCRAAGLSRTS